LLAHCLHCSGSACDGFFRLFSPLFLQGDFDPLLLLVFGVSLNIAIITDLLFAALTKSVATKMHHEKQLIDWQVARRLWLGSLPTSAICIYVLHTINVDRSTFYWLSPVIGYVLVILAVCMFFQAHLHRYAKNFRLTQSEKFKRWQPSLTVIADGVIGILVSLTSIGAGALGAILLTYLYPLRLTPDRLIATDVVHAIPLALFAGLGHGLLGNVDIVLLFYLLCGSVPGIFLGVKISARVSSLVLRRVLSVVLILIGVKLALS